MIKIFRESIDKYDEKFGEPCTQVLDIVDLLDYLDDVISYCKEVNTVNESLNDNYGFKVKRVVATRMFEQAVKELFKKSRTDVIEELKQTIIKLGKYEITSAKHNHPLKNTYGHMDIHLDGGTLILLYKYDDDDVLEIGFDQSVLNQILKLQDIVDHKELNAYNRNRKKYKKPTKEISLDKLFKIGEPKDTGSDNKK